MARAPHGPHPLPPTRTAHSALQGHRQGLWLAGYPLHRENRENGHTQKNYQGKHREFGNFVKTQGNWFAQVVSSLIVKVKDISIFAAKMSPKFLKLEVCQVSFVYVIVTNHVNWHMENWLSDRENTGNFSKAIGYPGLGSDAHQTARAVQSLE